MAKIYGFTALTGGGTGALDRAELDGTILEDKDMAEGVVGIYKYTYDLDADSGATADGELVIAPPNAGAKRWIMRSKITGTNTGDQTLPTINTLGGGFAACATAIATQAKAVTLAGYVLVVGGTVGVTFTNGNSATSPTLNINTAGAKPIYINGVAAGAIPAGFNCLLQYDGTNYNIINAPPTAVTPSTQAFADSAVVGTSLDKANADHKHAMPASPVGGGGSVVNGLINGCMRINQRGVIIYDNIGGTITTVGSNTLHSYATAGTFTFIPSKSGNVKVECWGAGGGGGNGSSFNRSGGGGGGGAYVCGNTVVVVAGVAYTIVVPAATGKEVDGANATFGGTTVVAAGGKKASGATAGAGGAVADCTGDVKQKGGTGGTGYTGGSAVGGAGGGGAGGKDGDGGNGSNYNVSSGAGGTGDGGNVAANTSNILGGGGASYAGSAGAPSGGGSGSSSNNPPQNGCGGAAGQVVVTAVTNDFLYTDDDTYTLDRWNVLSDGNRVVDTTQGTSATIADPSHFMNLTIVTANKKFGILQILEQKDARRFINQACSLSFKAKVSNARIGGLSAAIITWSSTADVVTSDIVNAWGAAGTDPTLVANWNYEGVADFTPTTDWATYKLENITPDTAAATNVAVFIWTDDITMNAADILSITAVQLEAGTTANTFQIRAYQQELDLCQRYCYGLTTVVANDIVSEIAPAYDTTIVYPSIPIKVPMRTAPTLFAVLPYFLLHDGVNAGVPVTGLVVSDVAINNGLAIALKVTVASGLTANRGYRLVGDATVGRRIYVSAEL